MLLTKKVKSFTITELIVVMILTTIVISITLLVLNLVQKELKEIQYNYSKTSEIKILELALWNDFNAASVYYLKEEKQLICSNPFSSTNYYFKEDCIIRNTDTLKIKITEVLAFRDNKTALGLIDGIHLKLSQEFQNRELFVYTAKAAQFYMND